MQRFLVFLVLALLVAVAALGFGLSSVSTDLDDDRLARDREKIANSRDAAKREDDPAKLRYIETKLKHARDENDRLRRDLSKVKTRVDDLAGIVARMSVTAPSRVVPDRDPDADGDARPPRIDSSDRQRDENGNFIVSAEDTEYFRAVQMQVDRGRRIDGQTRNYLRRITALSTRREIADIPAEKIADVEKVLRRYVTSNDDLVSAFVRNPSPAVKQLTDDDRADRLRRSREKFGNDAQSALRKLIGDEDTDRIAKSVFTNPWGIRRNGSNR
jgi:hypothetical protein